MSLFKGKKIPPAEYRKLYPFRSAFLRIKGLNYHYIDEGQGEAVVMLHGNPTWSFYFRQMVMALRPEFRVIVPDHMGCGLSDKPLLSEYDFRLCSRVSDLEQLLDHLNPGPITLMVHDWGGIIGMVYALRHPEKIAGLIITNTAAFFPPGSKKLPFRLWLLRYFSFFSVPAVLSFNLFARAALFMAPAKVLSTEVRKGLIAPYNCPRNRLATLKFVQDIPLNPGDFSYNLVNWVQAGLHTLSHLPMFIGWGKKDFVFDMDYYREWVRRFPQARTHVFADAGHYLLEDKPQEMAVLVKEFLKKQAT